MYIDDELKLICVVFLILFALFGVIAWLGYHFDKKNLLYKIRRLSTRICWVGYGLYGNR